MNKEEYNTIKENKSVYAGIHLFLTTKCNLKCPNCSAGIHKFHKETFTSIEDIKRMAPFFQNLEHLYLTGGEPTLHPDFFLISANIRDWYKPKKLLLWTNGYVSYNKILAFKYYDTIHVTQYDENSYEGSPNNKEQIEKVLRVFYNNRLFEERNTKILVGDVAHFDMKHNKGGNPCERINYGLYPVIHGRVYPCCVAPGVGTTKSVPVNERWLENITKTDVPCENCVFGEE